MPENGIDGSAVNATNNSVVSTISQDVLDHAREAAAGAREAMAAPTDAEPVNQPVPDVPADMSGVPDPYDVAGQEAYRADQREQALTERDAEPEPATAAAQDSVDTPVGEMSEADYEAALEQGANLANAGVRAEIEAGTPDPSPGGPEPGQPSQDPAQDPAFDISSEPTSEPTPEPTAPDVEPG